MISVKGFRNTLVQHLRKMGQIDDRRKETMYLVKIDDSKPLWLLELDLIYTACLWSSVESTKDLVRWYSTHDIGVKVPKSMEEDLTRRIRYIQGKDQE